MKQLFFLAFLFFSFSGISQEKNWTNRLEFQLSYSFSESDNSLRNVLWEFDGPKYQISINYILGWNTSFRLHKNILLESGLSFIRRKNENADLYNVCFHVTEDMGCFGVSPVITDRRHHLIGIPVRIRLQRQFNNKLIAYWSGGIDNYLHLFTVHKSSEFKNKEKYKNYHGYSINTAIGIQYPLSEKWNVELEVNSRLYEKYRQEEILGGDSDSYDTFYFNNINLMLSLNYYF